MAHLIWTRFHGAEEHGTLLIPLFIADWTHIAQRGMKALSIVEHLHVFKNGLSSLSTSRIGMSISPLPFEEPKKLSMTALS